MSNSALYRFLGGALIACGLFMIVSYHGYYIQNNLDFADDLCGEGMKMVLLGCAALGAGFLILGTDK